MELPKHLVALTLDQLLEKRAEIDTILKNQPHRAKDLRVQRSQIQEAIEAKQGQTFLF